MRLLFSFRGKNSKERASLGIFVLIMIILAMPALKTVHSLLWDESTKVTLSETSNSGPALVFDPANGKVFMAWRGTDSSQSLNVISSSDMMSWGGKVVTSFTAPDADIIDLAYDSNNQKLYMAWEWLQLTGSGPVWTSQWYMYVAFSSDGQTWSNPTLVTSGSGTNIFWSGLSIAYNSATNVLVVAVRDGGSHALIYQSTDGGISWPNSPSEVFYNGSPPTFGGDPRIRFINGAYFLTGALADSSGPPMIHIYRSTDLSTWSQSNPPNQSTNMASPPIAYLPAEGLYHLTYKSTNSGSSIWDTTSSDAVSWNCCYQSSESSSDQVALVYNPNLGSLLLAWTGTDTAGHLNLMQYRSAPTLTLSTNPSSVTIACTYYAGCDPGSTVTSTLTITSVNGFSGTVTLTYTAAHLGGPYVTGPSSASVSAGASTSVTITAHSGGTVAGNFVWYIGGSGGGYSTSTAFTIQYYYCRTCVSPSP